MQKSLKDEIKNLERKLADNPNSIFFARLADSYMQTGRLDEAIELCERGVRIHPNYVTGHYILGKCFVRKKLFDQAEKELKRVLSKDPKYISAHREYGELMAQIGWNSNCEMTFNEILQIDPLNDKAQQRLIELKKQFTITPEKNPPPEQLTDFGITQADDDIFSATPLSFDESEFDIPSPPPAPTEKIELKEPEFQLEETSDEPSAKLSDEESSIDLLEDIFGDNTIADLESELPQSSDDDTLQPMSSDEELQLTSANFPIENEFDEPEPEPDPFHILQQEREKELASENIFGTPFEPEKSVNEKKPPSHQPKPDSIIAQEPIQSADDDIKSREEKAAEKKEKIVTPTLGEIYAAQHQYSKAISVYELLLKKDCDNQFYKDKIKILQQKLEEEGKG